MKEIKLSQGKVALVDDEDFEYLNQWKWTAAKGGHTFYAIRNYMIDGVVTRVYMHRLIIKPEGRSQVDHKDHNGLNNQRSNLREVTHAQNQHNRTTKGFSSKYKGVDFNKRKGKWRARITKNCQQIHLGEYSSPEEAAIVYNKAAITLHGEFAHINKIPVCQED